MKTNTITIIAAACTAFALNAATPAEIANTPADQINALNAEAVLDAAIATTNDAAFLRALQAKAVDIEIVFAKLKGKLEFANTLRKLVVQANASEQLNAAAFEDFVNCWIAANTNQQQITVGLFGIWTQYPVGSNITFFAKSEVAAACKSLAASSSPYKYNAIANMLYTYGDNHRRNILDLCQEYCNIVVDAIKHGFPMNSPQVFDVAVYLADNKDIKTAKELIADIELFKTYKASAFIPILSANDARFEPEATALRHEFLNSIAKSDAGIWNVAVAQDLIDHSNNTVASIRGKFKTPFYKVHAALYLNDNDKLVDALAGIDDTIEPQTMNKIILILNSFDPDYRPAEVLKALKVINKKYTLKLYDNHDTWEPILSKVRALIDVYK